MRLRSVSRMIIGACIVSLLFVTACGSDTVSNTPAGNENFVEESVSVDVGTPEAGQTIETETDEGDDSMRNNIQTEDYFDAVSGRHAYDYLGTLENGKNMQTAYEKVKQICRDYYYGTDDLQYSFELDDQTFCYGSYLDYMECGISFEEAKRATIAVFYDCPLVYYAYTYAVVGNEEKGLSVFGVDMAYQSGAERQRIRSLIEDELDNIVSSVEADDPDGMKIEKIYNYLCENADYDTEMASIDHVDVTAHTIAGYALNHKAVCEGLSRTCQAAMTMVGVDCITASGYVYNDANDPEAHSGSHAWNMANENGTWVVLDVSSGCLGSRVYIVDENGMYRERPVEDQVRDSEKYGCPISFVTG